MALNPEKNYKSIILEIRPRLQSVNVIVTVLNENKSTSILLQNEDIQIIKDNTISTIPCKGMNIVPNSLSSIKFIDNFITFRFATNNNLLENFGSFKAELLQNTVASIESLSNKPLLSKGTTYTIQCNNCSKSLTAPIKFQRILPLPSDNADPADWFCHAHGSEDNVSLDPKEADIFYTHCYVHVNRINMQNIKGNDKVVVCKFCLNWLGTIYNPNTLRLWFNTVKFSNNNAAISTSSLSDVFHSIKDILKQPIDNSFKFMLTCQISSTQVDSVLIWVVEKKLSIMYDGSGTLKKYDVAKALFKFVKSDEPLFTKWLNDITSNTINVSKPMMLDVLKHLQKFNKAFPQEFSESNDFNISYLFMYDPYVD